MEYLIDTNICVFHLRGKINLYKILQEKKGKFYISEISILELNYGAEKSENPIDSYKAINTLLREFEILDISKCREKYAEEKNYLFRNGTPLHNEFDLLIGVTALVNNKILVTDNLKDFKNIRNLKTENWIER